MSSGHRNSKREEKHARNMGGFLCYVAGSFTPSICFFVSENFISGFRSLVLVKLLLPEKC